MTKGTYFGAIDIIARAAIKEENPTDIYDTTMEWDIIYQLCKKGEKSFNLEKFRIDILKHIDRITSDSPKVLIDIKGGIIQNISSNRDMRIVIVDWDNFDHGGEAISGELSPDYISKDLYDLYSEDDPSENNVREHLKCLNY